MADKTSEARILTVSEVNQIIKTNLEGTPELQRIYVRGELSNYKIYPSGHHYFTLKDSDGAIRCVLFRGQAGRLKFRPENGMKVRLFGRIAVFPRDGTYQIYCYSLSPEGVGELTIAFEQLKSKLYAEGLFAQERKKSLPAYPEKIAIVTSPAGAVIHDMLRILKRRYPIAKIILLPVRVQGVEAPLEIAGAIRYADRWHIGDVIITGRGGGSIEGLWAFNDERVVRAIAQCKTPVISAVGHEPDVTISDFVADKRAATPTHAAEIAVPDRKELLRWLQGARERMIQVQMQRLKTYRQQVNTLAQKRAMTNHLDYLQDKRMLLNHIQKRLSDLANAYLAQKRQRFAALTASLNALSPLAVLGRGYAVAQNQDGKILKSSREIRTGEKISVTLGEGSLTCTVEQIYYANIKNQYQDYQEELHEFGQSGE